LIRFSGQRFIKLQGCFIIFPILKKNHPFLNQILNRLGKRHWLLPFAEQNPIIIFY